MKIHRFFSITLAFFLITLDSYAACGGRKEIDPFTDKNKEISYLCTSEDEQLLIHIVCRYGDKHFGVGVISEEPFEGGILDRLSVMYRFDKKAAETGKWSRLVNNAFLPEDEAFDFAQEFMKSNTLVLKINARSIVKFRLSNAVFVGKILDACNVRPTPVFQITPINKKMIVAKNANVRAEPTTGSAKIGLLRKGTKTRVTGKVMVSGATWYQVTLEGNRTGYVFGKLMKEAAVDPPSQPSPAPSHVGATANTGILGDGRTVTGMPAYKANWSEWEEKNSVAREGAWLIIKQPGEGFCYVKQSYDGQPDRMEMSMRIDKQPFLPLPFFRGLDGDVTYWVDKGPIRVIRQEQAKNPLRLSKDVVPELKRGGTLAVRVKPVGERTREQRFSLAGFADAVDWLDRPICLEK